MTVALGMIVRDEETVLPRLLKSAERLADTVVAVDTGSTDSTPDLLEAAGAKVTQVQWQDFSHARNQVLERAAELADWVLMVDADTTITHHPRLGPWLEEDTSPDTDAWMVPRVTPALTWAAPLLTRAGTEWRYHEPVHEYLDCPVERRRPLLGLQLHHHGDGRQVDGKYMEYIRLLRPGYEAKEPRATYYTAQSYMCMGVNTEAARIFAERAEMDEGFGEERWHAQYMAARLAGDVGGLLRAFEARPWRPEPLERAAKIVRENGSQEDVLFLESGPSERMCSCQS